MMNAVTQDITAVPRSKLVLSTRASSSSDRKPTTAASSARTTALRPGEASRFVDSATRIGRITETSSVSSWTHEKPDVTIMVPPVGVGWC
jgi:hypothetical protein